MMRRKYWELREAIRERRPPAIIEKYLAFAYYGLGLAQSYMGSLMPRRPANSKHILLLVWSMPPNVNGGVYRPTTLVRYGTQLGWRFTVVTGPQPDQVSEAGKYIRDKIPASATIRHTEPYRINRRNLPFPDVDGGIMNALRIFYAGRRLVSRTPPAIVMASGPTFQNFIAAKLLARHFRAKLVLEYRDEWSQCPFEFVRKYSADHQRESECLSRSDAVIFTTISQLQHQVGAFETLNPDKCHVVPNGWDPVDLIAGAAHEGSLSKSAEPAFTLAYLGALGLVGGINDFLMQFEQVLRNNPPLQSRIKLKLVGGKSAEVVERLDSFPFDGIIEQVDQVPKADACRMMSTANALLILNPPGMSRYIAGKLYEYLASGTPILVYGEGGEIEAIIKNLGAGIVVPYGNTSALATALSDIRSIDRSGSKVSDWLDEHTRERLAGRTISILSACLSADVTSQPSLSSAE